MLFSRKYLFAFMLAAVAGNAHAEFLLSEMIVDFAEKAPRQHDVEIISKDKAVQYIAMSAYQVVNPGLPNEKRVDITDPTKSGLMMTPNKLALAPMARRMTRFLLLKAPGETEQIFRVAVKPVIQGVDEQKQKVALKVLVGYEVLVIVRPVNAKVDLVAERKGNSLTLTNKGNTNAYLQNGEQCDSLGANCKTLNVRRIYPGQSWTTTLPYMDGAVKYNVWDGSSVTAMAY